MLVLAIPAASCSPGQGHMAENGSSRHLGCNILCSLVLPPYTSGAALFDDRILVKNISGLLADRVVTWDDKEWANAPLPDEMDDAAK